MAIALRRACLPVRSSPHPYLRAPFTASSGLRGQQQPNAPLDLDPAFKALLGDVDASLLSHKQKAQSGWTADVKPRVLEMLGLDGEATAIILEKEREPRKSPAARFGGQRIGMAILPEEMQAAIFSLINASDKDRLHADAVRLFKDESAREAEAGWGTEYDVRYKSPQQVFHHAVADAAAFASIALPAHYSAIYSVLAQVRNRLGNSWTIDTVYDWGAGTGSAFWASSHVFQADSVEWGDYDSISERRLADSTLKRYTAFEERGGLSNVGKKLLKDIDMGRTDVQWRKLAPEEGIKPLADSKTTLAISAFHLSSLPSGRRRKILKEMWESRADVMVLIDHDSQIGFSRIIEAREYLLNVGNREVPDIQSQGHATGAHVVAPCPHGGACPIFHDSAAARMVCGFAQRMQRPSFVRHTKHSGKGHEDIRYSYVVIRRGPRPEHAMTNVGRIGEVGRRELDKKPIIQLKLHDEPRLAVEEGSSRLLDEEGSDSSEEMQEVLRHEAYQWPRLVFSPLKRSGHIILDVCSSDGKIMRATIPKSQGKQPYYDARKAEWGDIFPHHPKNPPQVRYQPSGWDQSKGERPPWRLETNKDRRSRESGPATSYSKLYKDIKENLVKEEKANRRAKRKEEKQVVHQLQAEEHFTADNSWA